MKATLLPIIFISSVFWSIQIHAESGKDEWQSTILSESTIKKVQEKKTEYKKCIAEKMQKPAFLSMDSRKATDEIIKLCEPSLAKMREVYLTEKVPGEIADRHLRQVRIQISRQVLENLMFSQANPIPGKP